MPSATMNALSNALLLAQSLAGNIPTNQPVQQGQTPGQAPAPAPAPQPTPQPAPGAPRPAPTPQVVDPMQQAGVAAAGSPAPAAQNAATAAARTTEAMYPNQANNPNVTMAQQTGVGNAAAEAAQQPTSLSGSQGTTFSAAGASAQPATTSPLQSPARTAGASPVDTAAQAAGAIPGMPGAQKETGWFDTLLNNLSGRNLQTPQELEDWRKLQTLGIVGNKLGAALGKGNPIVEGFGNTMGDVFMGNLASKNAEMREMSQQDALNKVLAAMGGVKAPGGATPAPITGTAGSSGKPSTTPAQGQPGGISALAESGSGFTPPSKTTSVDDLIGSIRSLRI